MNKNELDDEAIGSIVDAKIASSTHWYQGSRLTSERERVLKYYNGELPKRIHDGSSSYISNEVYDSVEMMKAQLLETFAGGKEIVKFNPTNPEDKQAATIATKYTDYVIFDQNDGYSVLSDAIHDALMARVGVAKVWWEERYDYEDQEFSGLPEEAIMGLASEDDITSLDASQDPMTGTYKGTLARKVNKCQVRIEVISPEEFSIEPQAKKLSKDYFCVHTTLKQYDDLVQIGYPEDKLKEAFGSADAFEVNSRPEVSARFGQIDTGLKFDEEQTQDEVKWLTVHECYIKLQRKNDKHAKLYKVVRIGKVTVDIEEVEDLPFVAWTPIPIPHSFYGNNFAYRIIQAQNIQTNLFRSIVDHASVTNNPRYTVLKGGLTNPRELLDNRLGGIVNVSRPDAVNPLLQAPLNPFIFQTIELLKAKTEQSTGISSLSQGLNKDAVSNQNSQGLVNDLVNMSQTRQKVIARNFANWFVIPLYLKVYDLVLKNEKKTNIIEVSGDWVDVDPKSWVERRSATASIHLGYGEMDRVADKYLQMAAMWAQDPQTSTLFTIENRYKMAIDVAKMRGIDNANEYLTPPDKVPPPQPDPKAMAEAQALTTKAEAAMVTAQAAMTKVTEHSKIEELKMTLDKMQSTFDNMIKQRAEDRMDADVTNKIDIAQREMDLEETMRPEEVKQTQIVSPK